ncbi:MAG: helix-turn-helix domain-containing protein [Nitrospirae bacterium]|nr:helix-turn-helix domain-containing protein [Nitrospirota bacterium]
MENRNLMSVSELSLYLNVKVKTLYGWIGQKEIPYLKIGRLVRFEKTEIDRWLEEKKVSPFDLDNFVAGRYVNTEK